MLDGHNGCEIFTDKAKLVNCQIDIFFIKHTSPVFTKEYNSIAILQSKWLTTSWLSMYWLNYIMALFIMYLHL